MKDEKTIILCPECNNPMHKAGAGRSGRAKYQNYRCNKCGRCWLNTKEPFVKREVG